MSMSIRRTKRTETGQDDAGVARHTPERHRTSRNSLPAEDLTFLAAWRNGFGPVCRVASRNSVTGCLHQGCYRRQT
jgi:hypothetical protein